MLARQAPPPVIERYPQFGTSGDALMYISFFLFILIPAPALPPPFYPLLPAMTHVSSSHSTCLVDPSS